MAVRFLDKQGAGDGAGSGDMLEMAMRIASEIPDMASEKARGGQG